MLVQEKEVFTASYETNISKKMGVLIGLTKILIRLYVSIMVEEGNGSALVIDKIVNTSSDNNLCFRPLEPRLESGLNIVQLLLSCF
ncbi:hypothetical protein WKH57_27605 [Niallia taxi]|uniref:hypothetical protein n=1 Tax=Niallia taxi TaxID=2499688 RepID=UPI0031781938